MTYKRYAVVGLICAIAAFGTSIFGSPASATPMPAPTDPADVIIRSASACVGPNAIATGEMLVDGNPVTFGDGKQMIQGGSTVTVNFTVAAGCDATKFGLAAYSNPIDTADPTYEEVQKQTYATSSTITRSSGQVGVLTMTLPNIKDCFYQVDFFTGDVIPAFGPNNFYGFPEFRLISVVHIERPNCVEVAETTTTIRQETTSTSTSTSTTAPEVQPSETPSGRPEVLGEVLEGTTTTSIPAQVLAEVLAATGSNEAALLGLAGAFAIAGGALTVASGALRRRHNAAGKGSRRS